MQILARVERVCVGHGGEAIRAGSERMARLVAPRSHVDARGPRACDHVATTNEEHRRGSALRCSLRNAVGLKAVSQDQPLFIGLATRRQNAPNRIAPTNASATNAASTFSLRARSTANAPWSFALLKCIRVNAASEASNVLRRENHAPESANRPGANEQPSGASTKLFDDGV
jgi:hypothetical protein